MHLKQFQPIIYILLVLSSGIQSQNYQSKKEHSLLVKPTILSSNNFDGNRIDCDIENNGMFVSHRVSGRSGLSWPKGYGTQSIYASGVWLGGIVDGQVRVSAGEFAGEFASGPWGGFHDNPQHKIYKVNKSDLSYPQGFEDFQNWPVKLGAPWVDNNSNGTYEPLPNGPDHPEFIGDQVLWMVMNDGVDSLHSVFNTTPLGVELQRTVFGYDKTDEFGDIMFIKDLIINKGNNIINDMYIGLWADPDLGDAADDFVGCDTTLGMGICYNDGDDVNFTAPWGNQTPFGMTPAVGYDFFQGPMVPASGETAFMFGKDIPNMKNLNMTTYITVYKWSPEISDPSDNIEAYNLMKGLTNFGNPIPFEISGGSKFMHPGDPTKDTGPDDFEYVDGDTHPSDDRRFLMSSGPFTMTPGNSQEVVYAIIHAADGTWDKSYLKLKQVDILAQRAYDAHFINGNPPPEPIVEVTELDDQIILTWDNSAESYESDDLIDINPDTRETTKYIFEGYNVYQSENRNGTGELLKIATFDRINDVKLIMDDVFDEQYGVNINIPVQSGTDSGIKRSFSIDHNYFDNSSLKLNREYYYIVTAYGYNEFGIPKTMESLKNSIIAVRPQIPNTWESTDETAVYGTLLDADHTFGNSDGSAYGVVVDPKALTGDSYEIFFDNDHYYLDVDGIWKATAQPGVIAKLLDMSPSTVTGSGVLGLSGTIDLNFEVHVESPDFSQASGVSISIPGAEINSATGPDGVLVVYPTANSVLFGDTDIDGYGDFLGGELLTINVATNSVSLPIMINYTIYDDGWATLICDTDGDGVIDPDMLGYCNAYGLGPGNTLITDAEGSFTIDEIGYLFKSIPNWNVRNTNTGEIVIEHQTIYNGIAEDNIVDGILIPAHTAGENANPIVDGLRINVNGPALTMKSVGVYANAAGPIDPPVEGLPYWRYPNWLVADGDYTNQQTNGSTWVFNTHPAYGPGGEETFFNSLIVFAGGGEGISALIPDDFEFRFTGNGVAYDYWGDGWFSQPLPFEVWNIGPGTPEDPSDDYKLITWLLDDDGSGDWGLVPDDHETSGGDNDPYTDRVYIHAPTDYTPGTVGHDNWWSNVNPDGSNVADWTAGPGDNDHGGPMDSWNVMSRTVFMNWNGGDAYYPSFPANINALEPEIGTIFRFVTAKPNGTADKFVISTKEMVGEAIAFDPSGIKVWPNPYFAYNPEEWNRFNQEIHFTHLPETDDCTIRIFDLVGKLIRKIEHTNGTQFEIWDVRNDYNWKIASGMYIVHIQTEEGEKILKLAVIQPSN